MSRRNFVIAAVIVGVVLVVTWRMFDRPGKMMIDGFSEVSMVAPMTADRVMPDSYALQKTEGSARRIIDNGTASPYPQTNDAGISVVDKRLIIKTGEFSVVVKNVSDAANSISRFIEEKKGIVVSNQIYNLDTNPAATVVVRVPVAEFAEVTEQIKAVGEIKSESVQGQDVTEEYIDLEAQLKNLRATETQFLEIMKRATQIQDVLAVQRELTTVRSSIESLEGRMKYLSESADYSTITIYLSSDSASLPIVDDSDQWKLIGEIKEALRSLVEFGKDALSLLIWIAIFIPVWGVLTVIVWLVIRKIKHKNNSV